MKYLHDVSFITSRGSTRVFLDNTEIKGCTHAEFKWDVNELPVVDLQITATEVNVNIEKADVIKWMEVDQDDKRTGQNP